MGYRVLATAVLVVHFTYLAYVVFGGFLAWRWPRTFWLHLAACAWGLAVIGALGMNLDCPLTWLENWARAQAGDPELTKGFVDRFFEGALYPPQYTGLLQFLAGATVFFSWLGVGLRWRARRRRNTTETRKSEDPSSNAATV
jgi:hypothetical protein